MLSPPSASFRAHYQALVASGAIEPDAAQAEAAEAFADLEQRLAGLTPLRQPGLRGRPRGRPPPRGAGSRPKSRSASRDCWAACLRKRTGRRRAASTFTVKSAA